MSLKNDRWSRVKELFQSAVEREPAQRRSFLDEACGDAELRREILSLLEADALAEDFIEQPAVEAAEWLAVKRDQEIKNLRFGAYRIVHEIGRGGMGAVFLAERSDGEFQQRVALKIVRRSFADSELARRFRRERQILASLNHPNIARLLDGGVSADGEPFLVMEYVEGAAIDDYCDEHQLSIDGRLRLFLDVCRGVSYAHSHLVVHRDIKPSNILVDEEGTPKLLDFGIAKLLDAEGAGAQAQTNLRAFTPEYAAPEQLRGESVTTASDIYSLGVVLYELLTGARPYNFKTSNVDEIVRLISDVQPPRPSAVWKNHAKTIAREGEEAQEKLAGRARTKDRKLKGDLDNIVLMALRKEPERRYKSVEAFAEDIERHLEGLPVAARPNTFSYRAAKFINRNKAAVAAAAFVLLSLVAGLAISLRQTSIAREQARIAAEAQRQAEQSAAEARREADKSQKVSRFMSRILSYANPAWYAEGSRTEGEAKIIEVVDELADKIDTKFPNEPDIQAELHHELSDIYRAKALLLPESSSERQKLARRCLFHATRALELGRQVFGEEHEEVAKDLYYLFAAQQVNHKPESLETLRRAIEMMRATNPRNANLPYMLEDLGTDFVNKQNNWAEAERLLTEALTLFRQQYGDAHYNVARIYANLARAAAMQRNSTQAEMYRREAEKRMNNLTSAAEREGVQRLLKPLENESR